MPAKGYTLEELEKKVVRDKEQLHEFRSALAAFSDSIEKINPDMRSQINELYRMLDAQGALLDKLLTAGQEYIEALREWHRTTERS